ncbi:MAG: hypothetical protein ACJ79H_17125 [Myxococcales bacterium]
MREGGAGASLSPARGSYFAAWQPQPPVQRQALLHAHRSPHWHRSAFTFAHPQDVFSHRHSFCV